MQTLTQERLNALQDELDRILSAKKTLSNRLSSTWMRSSTFLAPELEAIDRALNGMLRNTKGVEEVYPNRPLLGLGSITGAIYEAKMCAYLIGLNVGLRMMGASRENIDDLLFDSRKSLEPR